MSASTERKIRKDAITSGTDRKTQARLEEERKKKKEKTKWTVGTIICVVLVVAILILGSSIPAKTATAATINGVKHTAAEVNYYVGAQYVYFVNQYGSYASYFGLDTSYGVSGLANQVYDESDGTTWLDYFKQAALSQMSQVQAFTDYANANNITLTEDEIAEVDEEISYISENAASYGYKNADAYFAANYGTGVTTKLVRQCLLDSSLASKAYTEKSESFTYTDEELEDYYQSQDGDYDYFTYLYYTVTAETVTTADADGNETTDVTDETMAAAQEKAEAILASFGESKAKTAEEAETALNEAIAAAGEDGTASTASSTRGSSLGVYKDFMKSASALGEGTVVENSSSTGYSIGIFLERNDNHYNTQNFRHILIQAEANEDGEYTEEALAAAKTQIDEIYAEYKAGDQTEDAFAELANTYSEDSGSNTTGGLYEDVYKGQMVSEINDWLFDARQPGDTEVCFGESSSYQGYHIVYYVGEGDLYSNVLARSAKSSEDLSSWVEEVTADYTAVEAGGMRYVGK